MIIIKAAATNAQPLLNVVHTAKPKPSMTSTLNMDPGHTHTKRTVKNKPAT